MKVKELIEKLKQYDGERDVFVRFALDEDDDIGYIFTAVGSYEYLDDRIYIIAEDSSTEEDYASMGQFDLKELYKKAKEESQKARAEKNTR